MDRIPHPSTRSTLGGQIPRPSPSKCIRDAACAIPATTNRLWGEEHSGSYFVGFHRNRSTQPTTHPSNCIVDASHNPLQGAKGARGRKNRDCAILQTKSYLQITYLTKNPLTLPREVRSGCKYRDPLPTTKNRLWGEEKVSGCWAIFVAGHSPAATNPNA